VLTCDHFCQRHVRRYYKSGTSSWKRINVSVLRWKAGVKRYVLACCVFVCVCVCVRARALLCLSLWVCVLFFVSACYIH